MGTGAGKRWREQGSLKRKFRAFETLGPYGERVRTSKGNKWRREQTTTTTTSFDFVSRESETPTLAPLWPKESVAEAAKRPERSADRGDGGEEEKKREEIAMLINGKCRCLGKFVATNDDGQSTHANYYLLRRAR